VKKKGHHEQKKIGTDIIYSYHDIDCIGFCLFMRCWALLNKSDLDKSASRH